MVSSIITETSYIIIIAISFGSNCLNIFGIFVPKFDPTDRTSLFPILLLILKESYQVFLKNVSEVGFWCGKVSLVFQFIHVSQDLVVVINGDQEAEDSFAPDFQRMP